MKSCRNFSAFSARSPQAGSTLLETAIACCILLICAVGGLNMVSSSFSTTENQGHLLARTVEYSQDKVEQLLALAYCDSQTDTTQLTAAATGGTGLAGCPVPLQNPATGTSGIGGSSDPSNPATGYVDYLDSTGTLVTGVNGAAPATWFYKRVWQLAAGPAGITQTKKITVTTRVKTQVGGAQGSPPQATVSVIKTYPF
ncbi:MAG TPA: hypothetical protein VGK48_01135 [Terriglobia bacterium]|jgi:hypothetical protein